MDHHLVPPNAIGSTIKVPLVCDEYVEGKPYDEGPFLSYPQRIGRGFEALTGAHELKDMPSPPMKLDSHPTPEKESFLQSWLFFGLIHAFLQSHYHHEDYFRLDQGNTWLKTDKLLSQLQNKLTELTIEKDFLSFRDQTRECLSWGSSIIRQLPDDFDWRIKISIQSVIELMTRFLNVAAVGLGRWDVIGRAQYSGLFLYPGAEQAMIEGGWCPSILPSIIARFDSLYTYLYLSRMGKQIPGRSHKACSRDSCRLAQIDPKTFELLHNQAGCKCKPPTIDHQKINDIIGRDKLPVLSISGDVENLQVEVVEAERNTKYVALSHVWADGLGNPNGNVLASCQLARIGKIVTDLDGSELSGKGDIFVWIDTVLCPQGRPELKAKTLKNMRDIYSGSTCTLVLDAWLERTNCRGLSALEACLHILVSTWTFRLWTLQEGRLPSRVFVKFADMFFDFDALSQKRQQELRWEPSTLISSDVMSYWMATRKTLIRKFRPAPESKGSLEAAVDEQEQGVRGSRGAAGEQGAKNLPDDDWVYQMNTELYEATTSITFRGVTVPSDEPVCIAGIFGIPAKDYARIVDPANNIEQRMAIVWRSIASMYGGRLPLRAIALSLPRLRTPGFRWAPRTLLNSEKSQASQWHYSPPADLIDRGLRARLDGLLFEFKLRKKTLSARDLEIAETELVNIPIGLRTGADCWFALLIGMNMPFASSVRDGNPRVTEFLGKRLAVSCITETNKDLSGKTVQWEALIGEVEDGATSEEGLVFSTISPIYLFERPARWDSLLACVDDILLELSELVKGRDEWDTAEEETRAQALAQHKVKSDPGLKSSLQNLWGSQADDQFLVDKIMKFTRPRLLFESRAEWVEKEAFCFM